MPNLPAFAAGLLLASLLSSSCANPTTTTPPNTKPAAPTATAPANGYPDPAVPCLLQGGTYLGNMRCQLPNGLISPVLYGAEAQRAMLSSIPVMPKSPHAWALATTAILFEFNRHHHEILSGTFATPDGQEVGKKLLADAWGVNNHDELLETLKWLQFQGHRADFDELGSRVDALSDQQFVTIETAAQGNPQGLNQLDIARKNHRALGQKGILAWDLVRYIALCRWGNLAGYMSDTEAWDHIMPAALRLQRSFSSWQDLQSDFLIGREYWSLQQTRTNGDRFRAIYDRFLDDPSSPWNTNSWALDLKVAVPLQIEAN
jgi:hypothetical protein